MGLKRGDVHEDPRGTAILARARAGAYQVRQSAVSAHAWSHPWCGDAVGGFGDQAVERIGRIWVGEHGEAMPASFISNDWGRRAWGAVADVQPPRLGVGPTSSSNGNGPIAHPQGW